MDFHTVFDQLSDWVVFFVPRELQEVTVVVSDDKGMEHLLDVCHECKGVLAEAYQDTQQAVCEVRS